MNTSQSQMADMGMVSELGTFAPVGTNQCCQVSPAETVQAAPERISVSSETSIVTPIATPATEFPHPVLPRRHCSVFS